MYKMTSGLFGCTLAKGLENEYSDQGLPCSMFKVGENWEVTLATFAHSVSYTQKFDCFSIVETVVDGNVMGGDCEIASIQIGSKFSMNTDESSEDASDDKFRVSLMNQIRMHQTRMMSQESVRIMHW